jgi:signal transduction histidine kinase
MRALATGVIAAGDRERAAIARELHDSTAQRIAALVLELSVAARDTSESEVAERLRDARETSNGTDVDVEVDANRILKRLPRQVETVLYRVAQEADLAEVQRRHRSLGLISMRERVALVDGWIEIKTANGNGTTITASVPVAAAHNALHAVHDALDKEIA